jgi:hypothetical protein
VHSLEVFVRGCAANPPLRSGPTRTTIFSSPRGLQIVTGADLMYA